MSMTHHDHRTPGVYSSC